MPRPNRILSCCLALTLFGSAASAVPPNGFTETVAVASNALTQATGIAWAPDGSNRLFVTRKSGEVRIVQNGAVLPTPFATISVYTNSECGLIGMCFDPDFLSNRYVYLFATVANNKQQIIRFRDNNGVGIESTVLVDNLPTAGNNHDGGAIGIGPDGYLYWAIGDLGNGTGVDANLTSLAAKVGRADRFTGLPVADNPFYDGVGPNNDFIWARGFRNPFTFTFQPSTGDLWVNVVGTSYEQVFLVNEGDHIGYDNYENNQPAGYLQPKISYRTNNFDTRNITPTGVSRVGGVTTVTTTGDHGFWPGQRITISGVTDASFNNTYFIQDRLSTTSFTVAQPAQSDATSGGGTAASDQIGGCISGGTFYESTLFPAEYHGNYFFGDFNSGNMARTQLDLSNKVLSVQPFVTGSSSHIDTATGPDGALYYIGHSGGSLKKLVPTASQQNLIVYPTAIPVPSGGSSLFTVRLQEQPASNVTVTIAKELNGDEDIHTDTTTLTFTPANWNQLQSVVLTGEVDDDDLRGTATYTVSAPGLTSYQVRANEIGTQVSNTTLLYRVGDQVPGEAIGNTFASFGLPSLDGDVVAFDAVMKQGSSRLPVLVGGTPTQVLWRKGDQAPGINLAFTKLEDAVFNGGNLAFYGTTATGTGVTSANNVGLWSDVDGNLRLIARKGDPAPGTGGAKYFSFTGHNLPGAGGLVFQAKLTSGTGPTAKVTARNDVGLWREGAIEPTLILREGSFIAIAAGDDREVKSFQVFPKITGSPDQRRSILDDGAVLAWVTFYDQSQAVIKYPLVGAAEIVSLTGDLPTSPAGSSAKLLGNAAGTASHAAFRGTLAGSQIKSTNDSAIFFTDAADLEVPAQEGTPLGNLNNALFSALDFPAFTNGKLLFAGTLKTGVGSVTAKNDRGLFTLETATLTPLVREGQVLGSRVFDKITAYAATPEADPDAAGGFLTQFRTGTGGISGRNDTALCAWDASGILHVLQQEGTSIELTPSLSAGITALTAFQSSVRTPGQGRAVSTSKKIIYRATLGRYGQAILVSELP